MGQFYVDPSPRALNPGIFSSHNTRAFDPDSDTPQRAQTDLLMEHYQNNQRIGVPTVIKAIVLRSTMSQVTETTFPETSETEETDAEKAARRIYQMMFPPTGKISLTCRIPGIDVLPPPVSIPIESNVWTKRQMEIETYGETRTSSDGDETHNTQEPTPEHKDSIPGEQDPMPDLLVIALHGTFITSDPHLLQQPLPIPGTMVEIRFDDITDRTTGQYLGPVLTGFEGSAYPQSGNPSDTAKPKNPPDTDEDENDTGTGDTTRRPTGKPSGKVPPREAGPEAQMNLVYGGYNADSGVVYSGGKVRGYGFEKGKWDATTGQGKPRYGGGVSLQAWRNAQVHGGVGGTAEKTERTKRGDNYRVARCTGARGKGFLRYVAEGGSGKSNPLNSDRDSPGGIKGLSGTFTFDRVRELVAKGNWSPLEKYIACQIAAHEDQSDRPYSLNTGGWTGKTQTKHQKLWKDWTATECGMYVTNVRNIAYVLFDGAGTNLNITKMTYEQWDKANKGANAPGAPVGAAYPPGSFPSHELFINIMDRDAPSYNTKADILNACIYKPGHRRAKGKRDGSNFGMTVGSFINMMLAPAGRFTPWDGSVAAMPGDILLPRPKIKTEQWMRGEGKMRSTMRGRLAMMGHICLLFSGPNGILRNGESGGAYRGSGSMTLEDYMIRATKCKSGVYFPNDIWLFEPPEMTAIWKTVPGGRPTRKWTPALFRELCPNLTSIPEVQTWLS